MTGVQKNILFIDAGSGEHKEYINKLFIDEPISVTAVTGLGEFNSEDCRSYDLVIIRQKENQIREVEKIIVELKKCDTSFLVLSSTQNADEYYQLLEEGVSNYISIPCGKNYLKIRILEVLYNTNNINCQNSTCHFGLTSNRNSYQFSINYNDLGNFITSQCNSLAHQNKILNKVLKHDCIFVHNVSHYDLIDNEELDDNCHEILLNDLQKALNNNEFHVYYQPIISLRDNTIIGFESLLRWYHSEKGILNPAQFIPLAEETELIIEIGSWVIMRVAEQVAAWIKQYKLHENFRVSINLSAKQFVIEELCDIIFEIVEKQKIDHSNLAFEITETSFMRNMDAANMMLLRLHAKEHNIYLDDFGTGYSSLSYLQHFPVNVIKIDKSFVQWMHIDEQSEKIVKTIIDLAHNLGMSVVAEGVEEAEHVSKLQKMGCDYAQGFYYAKALNKKDAGEFLAAKNVHISSC